MSFLARGLCVAIAIAFVQSSGAQVVPEHAQLANPQGEPVVVGSIHRIQSSAYGDEQVLTVRLPRGYAENPDKRSGTRATAR